MKYFTITCSPPGFLALLFGAMLLGLVSQSALAANTAAGTLIGNTATLTYSVSGTAQNSIDSSAAGNSVANTCTTTACTGTGGGSATQFLVDFKVNLSVTGGSVSTVQPGEIAAVPATAATSGAYVTYTISNSSNATEGFLLTAAEVANGTVGAAPSPLVTDAFDTSAGTTVVYEDTNGNGVFDTGDAVVAAGTATQDVASNGTLKIFVASTIPGALANGVSALVSLQAQAAWPSVIPAWAPGGSAIGTAIAATAAGPNSTSLVTADVVFADGQGIIDAATPDGKYSAYDAYTIAAATLTVAKTAVVYSDPVNLTTNPKMIPGAIVTYTITITNAAGGSTASSVTVSDSLAAEIGAGTLAYQTQYNDGITSCAAGNGIVIGVTCNTNVGGDDNADFGATTANAVTAAVGSIAAGSSATVKFQAVVQ